MADEPLYDEGTVLRNPADGSRFQLTNGNWVSLPADTSPTASATTETASDANSTSLAGLGKSLLSGAVHEGIPSVVGLPGSMVGLPEKGMEWLYQKAKNAAGYGEPEYTTGTILADPKDPTKRFQLDAQGNWNKVDQPTPSANDISTPSTSSTADLVGAKATAKDRPVVFRSDPNNPNGPRNILPTVGEVSNMTHAVAPDYQPQNFWERAARTTGAFLPAAAMGPAAEGNLMTRALVSGARNAAAPALASEGSREIPFVKGSPVEEPLAMAAALAASPLASKFISPNPAPGVNRAAAQVLDRYGATYTPKQLSGGNLELEGKQANAWGSGTSASALNAQNEANYTRGAIRAVSEPLPEAAQAAPVPRTGLNEPPVSLTDHSLATAPVIKHIDDTIDSEFNRLTGRRDPNKPLGVIWDTQTQREFKPIMKDYTANKIVKDQDPEVQQAYDKIQTLLTPTSGAHWIDADKYQIMRSELGDLAQNAPGPAEARAYSRMQSTLDNSMRRVFNHFYPDDVGAFDNVRRAYVNQLILKRALPVGSHGVVTPDNLASSANSILGHDNYLAQTHPVAQYADAGQKLLSGKNLDPGASSGIIGDLRLGALLSAGHPVSQALTGHGPALSTALTTAALAAPFASRPIVGRMLGTDAGRRLLSNQVLPPSAQPNMLRNPASAALIAEALSRQKKEGASP